MEQVWYNALRGQKTARAGGGLPAPLSEVAGRQVVSVRHSGNQLIDDLPSVQILDAPMPQMAGTVLDFCRTLDLPGDEQVITVPKFSTDRVPQRLVERCFPQLAEQLVEVPTVLSYSLLQQRTAEQTIGFPVPGRGGGARGGLQGLSQGQGSTADFGADFVVSPVPHGRGGGARGGLHGLSQGQGSTTFPPPERISERIMEQNVDFPGGGLHGVQGFLTRQSSAALSEQVPVSAVHAATAPVVEFMASAPAVHAAPAPVGEFMASAPSVHAAPGSSGDDASRVEQDIDVEGVDYLGRVVYHSGTCEFHDMAEYIWRSQGVGTFRLLRHSTGVKFFQFWRLRQLLVEDVISGLVLLCGDKGRSWRWLDPEFKDGPNDYRHAVRFQSAVQARRFHEEWYSS